MFYIEHIHEPNKPSVRIKGGAKIQFKFHKNLNQRIEGMSELACRVEF